MNVEKNTNGEKENLYTWNWAWDQSENSEYEEMYKNNENNEYDELYRMNGTCARTVPKNNENKEYA